MRTQPASGDQCPAVRHPDVVAEMARQCRRCIVGPAVHVHIHGVAIVLVAAARARERVGVARRREFDVVRALRGNQCPHVAARDIHFADDGMKRRRPMHIRKPGERDALAVATPDGRRRASVIGTEAEGASGQLSGFPARGRCHPQLPGRYILGQQEMAVGDLEHPVVRLDGFCVKRRILRNEREAFPVRTPGIVIHALLVVGRTPCAATVHRHHEDLGFPGPRVLREERQARAVS